MLTEMAQLLETLVAHFAHVRSLIRVRTHMPLQHAGKTEFLLTIHTLQGGLYLRNVAFRRQLSSISLTQVRPFSADLATRILRCVMIFIRDLDIGYLLRRLLLSRLLLVGYNRH